VDGIVDYLLWTVAEPMSAKQMHSDKPICFPP
jgi:hypothetical protein